MRQGLPALVALFFLVACGGGGGGSGSVSGFLGGGGGPGLRATQSCQGNCDPGSAVLNEQQVMTIITQAASEMRERGVDGIVAVVDRVGNPLGVWGTDGSADLNILITSRRPRDAQVPLMSLQNGLENVMLPAGFGAVSKAITGAFLSSQGNAFSSRTANYIVNATFPPRNDFENSGPLFGVQFSQLSCGDWVRRDDPMLAGGTDMFDGFLDGRAGPKRSPLGFSADPGGFPLYINGVIVGGLGITVAEDTALDADGNTVPVSIYGVDGNPQDVRANIEEQIALTAQLGFEPNDTRRASTVTVMGRLLRYSNSDRGNRRSRAETFASSLPSGGSLVAVPGFYDGTRVFPGVRVGAPESGIVAASGSIPGGPGGFGRDRTGRQIDPQILVNPDGTPFLGRNEGAVTNPRASLSPPAPIGMTADEALSIVDRALSVAQEGRAQIRQPSGSSIQVNVHVCDRDGNSIAYARTKDAPLFGSSVALQKCRTAAIFSRGAATAPPGSETEPDAAALLLREDAFFQSTGFSKVGVMLGAPNGLRDMSMAQYLQRVRDFIPNPSALSDGVAFSDRAAGNLARPCFPDGVNCRTDGRGGILSGALPGPLSVEDPRSFSPLSNGFQLEYVKDYVIDGTLGRAFGVPEPSRCGTLAAGGFQIFPGSVPVFKRELDANGVPTGRVYQVGGVGISGDGVDQDDMVAFLGLDRAVNLPGSLLVQAPPGIRASQVSPRQSGGTRLRFVNCPPSPFNPPFEDEQNVCEGK